jgi:response regulator RpfG family c-di-GMP phosphodiesterase
VGCDRVSNKAWPEDRILDFFREQRGKQFDPELTDIFLESMGEIRKIKKTFSD